MGLLDQVKAAAAEAAIKAKETAEELQTKRELGHAYGELGQEAFAQLESGEMANSELDPLAARVRALKAQLEPAGPAAANGAEDAQPSNE